MEKAILRITMTFRKPKGEIKYLFSNGNKTKLIGSKGRAAVISRYNWASQEKRLIELYESIV